MRARSWRTALIFRSSTTVSSTLSSSQKRLKKTPGATPASPLTSTAPTPRQLRSTWKVVPVPSSGPQLCFDPVADEDCVFICAGASSSDSEGEHHFERTAQ